MRRTRGPSGSLTTAQPRGESGSWRNPVRGPGLDGCPTRGHPHPRRAHSLGFGPGCSDPTGPPGRTPEGLGLYPSQGVPQRHTLTPPGCPLQGCHFPGTAPGPRKALGSKHSRALLAGIALWRPTGREQDGGRPHRRGVNWTATSHQRPQLRRGACPTNHSDDKAQARRAPRRDLSQLRACTHQQGALRRARTPACSSVFLHLFLCRQTHGQALRLRCHLG